MEYCVGIACIGTRAHKVVSVGGILAASLLPSAIWQYDAPFVCWHAAIDQVLRRFRFDRVRWSLTALVLAITLLDHASWYIMGACMPWELLFFVLQNLPLMLTNLNFLQHSWSAPPVSGPVVVGGMLLIVGATWLRSAMRRDLRRSDRTLLRLPRSVAAWGVAAALVATIVGREARELGRGGTGRVGGGQK